MKKQDIRIVARVTQKEKDRISDLAKRCGLSTTEYLRQRALGYEPKPVPPDALFRFCERLDALIEQPFSAEVNPTVSATKSYYVEGGFSHLIHMTAAHLW